MVAHSIGIMPRRCADEISFNGYRLLSTNLSPLEHVLKVGEQRYFYNLQLRGKRTRANHNLVVLYVLFSTPW